MAIHKILIIDDELLLRNFLAETLKRKGHEIATADCGKKGLALVEKEGFDLVITDMKMPDITGLEVLKKVKEIAPETLVIVITAYGSIENAVEAMQVGAFNYLLKPFSPDAIEATIERAQEHQNLVEENRYLRQQVVGGGRVRNNHTLIAESPVMQQILADVKKIAASNATVFISGESGTGKEVIAHAIHQNSPRNQRPFIRVNCAAVPETLIESEFFGHEKGAFTGALSKRLGRFELASGGTLLLDEVSEIPINLQAKLLRVVQEQELERVGGSKLIKTDVRLISTSNRDMKKAVENHTFREDLYYRLNVIPIHLPPLRERREDIIPLATYFLENMCLENSKKKKKFSPAATQLLQEYSWPGNIRELANIMERLVVMDYGQTVQPEHLMLDEKIIRYRDCDLPAEQVTR